MSDALDALIPPRQTDFAVVPLPEPEVEEEADGLENYTFDSVIMRWSCNICEAYVAIPYAHTRWHDQLLGGLDKDDSRR